MVYNKYYDEMAGMHIYIFFVLVIVLIPNVVISRPGPDPGVSNINFSNNSIKFKAHFERFQSRFRDDSSKIKLSLGLSFASDKGGQSKGVDLEGLKGNPTLLLISGVGLLCFILKMLYDYDVLFSN